MLWSIISTHGDTNKLPASSPLPFGSCYLPTKSPVCFSANLLPSLVLWFCNCNQPMHPTVIRFTIILKSTNLLHLWDRTGPSSGSTLNAAVSNNHFTIFWSVAHVEELTDSLLCRLNMCSGQNCFTANWSSAWMCGGVLDTTQLH